MQGNPLTIGTDPQLFLDDYCIESMDGLTREMRHPRRVSEPVLDRERFGTTTPYVSVVHDGDTGRFRLWYNRGSSIWHCDSADGIAWENPRPVYELSRAYGCSLIDDRPRADDPGRRFKLANWQSTRRKDGTPDDDSGMWVAFSPDGFRWTGLDKPVLPMWPEGYADKGYPDDPYGLNYVYQGVADIIDVYYDPIRKHYGAAVKQWSLREDGFKKPRRLVAMTRSDDFVQWDPIWRIVEIDGQDQGETEFYGMGGIHARGTLLIGFVRVLRDDLPHEPDGPANGIGYTVLAISRDGRTWHRFREPFLDRNSQPGTWDRAMTWIGARLPVDDEMFLYYGGYSAGHKVGKRQLGLARMRKDGYVALRAGEHEGSLLTPPLIFEGNRLTVNVEPSDGGWARVEIRDLSGRPMEGFSGGVCDAVRKDSVAHTVTWQGNHDVSSLAGKPVRLRFAIQSASLYAFRFDR